MLDCRFDVIVERKQRHQLLEYLVLLCFAQAISHGQNNVTGYQLIFEVSTAEGLLNQIDQIKHINFGVNVAQKQFECLVDALLHDHVHGQQSSHLLGYLFLDVPVVHSLEELQTIRLKMLRLESVRDCQNHSQPNL